MVSIQSISLSGFHPLEFFSKLGSGEKTPAYFTSGAWTILAWNPKCTIRSKDMAIFEALKEAQKKRSIPNRKDLPFIGGTIGFLGYDGGGIFHEYDQALLWNGKKLVVIGDKKYIGEVWEIWKRSPERSSPPTPLLRQERGDSHFSQHESSSLRRSGERCPAGRSEDRLRWTPSITRARYGKAFKKIQRDIRHGEYYQLNLTYALEADSACDHRQMFCALVKANPASCAAYFEDRNFALLSLSPERFVTIENGFIVTCPIKGTRPRGKNSAEDLRFKNELLKSEKEAAELNMITDLLRNDIGKVSLPGSVRVAGHRLLQKNPFVWHTYSVIEGRLARDIHPIDALQSMFPGGSVTGCPKRAAMKRIAELENTKRGPYCGSMVMLSDDGRLDSTVLIRTIVAEGEHLSLGIGGGIVADSGEREEWEETKQKAKAFSATLSLT